MGHFQMPSFSQHESDRLHSSQLSRQARLQSGRSPEPPKEHTPSSSRPAPLHPILKKPRGPSTSGPRPTARFVSPPGSEDETSTLGEEPSSTSTANTGMEMRPSPASASPAKMEKRGTPTKKFVVSTTASKRRPVLPRRPSSQSSTGSDPGSKEGTSTGSRYTGSHPSIPTIAEHTNRAHVPRSHGSSASPLNTEQQPGLSAKAAGKRPATKAQTEKRLTPRNSSHHAENQERPLVIQPSPTRQPALRDSPSEHTRGNIQAHDPVRTTVETSRDTTPPELSPVPTDDHVAPIMARSSSNIESRRPRELTPGRPPPRGLLSSSVAATSDVAVQGTFDFENPDPSSILGTTLPEETGLSGLVSRPSTASLLEARFTPTQPSPTPAVPLGRSKSQLTLLLEREKARVGDIRPHRDKKKGEDKDKDKK